MLEHNDGTLTIGNEIVGVIKTESKAKVSEIFPEIIVSEGMLVPLATVYCVPVGAREEIGTIRKEEDGAKGKAASS